MRLFIAILGLLLLSGCAYNAARDPNYQAYLRGDISYDTYVQSVNNMNARRMNTIAAFQQFNTGVNQAIQQRAENSRASNQILSSSPQQSYNLSSGSTTNCYQVGDQIHCDTRDN
jgi:hypothetical protein